MVACLSDAGNPGERADVRTCLSSSGGTDADADADYAGSRCRLTEDLP